MKGHPQAGRTEALCPQSQPAFFCCCSCQNDISLKFAFFLYFIRVYTCQSLYIISTFHYYILHMILISDYPVCAPYLCYLYGLSFSYWFVKTLCISEILIFFWSDVYTVPIFSPGHGLYFAFVFYAVEMLFIFRHCQSWYKKGGLRTLLY